MKTEELERLLKHLTALPKENEWCEFKIDNKNPETIGEMVSAISNSANLRERPCGYMVWGVENETHEIVGTKFSLTQAKKGNEELENWLIRGLNIPLDLRIYEFSISGKNIVLLEIPATINRPIEFKGNAFVRVGSLKKNLKDYPEKEEKIWKNINCRSFEKAIAKSGAKTDQVLELIDYPSYFELTNQSLPSDRGAILEKLVQDKIIISSPLGYNITNLGAILFAKDITKFEELKRKAVRVIIYEGKNRIKTIKEQEGTRGYATGFKGLVEYINSRLPSNEEIEKAFRVEKKMYPEIAIRELIANALIHQDFFEKGTSPMVEIFSDRIEISNPGNPLINTDRFIDHPPQSRNEDIASFMRRINVCEERGSGIDKVISSIELFQLPAPKFEAQEKFTRVTLYSHKTFQKMSREDRVRACYQHCCLKYVSNEQMTNSSLRKRLNIVSSNYPIASKVISDALKDKYIKLFDPENKSKKHTKYVPIWA